jgi:transposase
MGDVTALTPEVQARICKALAAVNYRETAANAGGVTGRTVRNWCARGAEGEEPFASFLSAVEKAEAKAERLLLRAIRRGVDGWQSRAWIMERRWPARWSGRVRVTVTEHVDQLTAKLKADPELHRRVVDVLADQEPATSASGTH